MKFPKHHGRIPILALSAILISQGHALTSNWTYTGTTATELRWDSPTSWSTNPAIPNAVGDIANFNAELTASKTISLSNGEFTVGTLTIGDPTRDSPTSYYSNYTLSGGTPSGLIIFDQTGVADAILSLPVVDSNAGNLITARVQLNDNLVINTQTNDYEYPVIALTNAITDGNGSFSITKNGPSIIRLAGANTFDGGLTINEGSVVAGRSTALGTGLVTVANGTQVYMTSGTDIYANNFSIAGNGIIEGSLQHGAIRLTGSTVSGAITLAGDARITAFGKTGFLTGIIGESAPGKRLELGNFSTTDDSTITVSGSNTYTGGTYITGATVIATHNSAFSTGDIDLFSNGTAARLARIQLGTNVTLNNDIYLSSSAQTGSKGAIYSYAGDLLTPSVAILNGTISVINSVGNGGHLAAEPNSASILRITGQIKSIGGVTPVIGGGNVEIGGGGNYYDLQVLQGNLKLVAAQGVNPTATLNLGGSGTTSFNLNGFNQTLSGLTQGAGASTITNNGAASSTLTLNTFDDSSFPGTFVTGVSTLNLVKSNEGILSLPGASTAFTGSTTVSAGGMNLTGTLGGAGSTASFASGTTLSGEGTFGGNLTLVSPVLHMNGSTPAGISAANNLQVSGGTVQVSLDTLPATPTTMEVIAYGGTVTGSASNFNLIGGSSYRTPTFTVAANKVTLAFGAPVNLTWTGSGDNSDWDINTTSNWQTPGLTGSKFFIADYATFGDAPASDPLISLTGSITATDLIFTNSLRNYTFQGPGSLTANSLTKTGSGTVTFTNGLAIGGSITHSDGILRFAPDYGITQSVAAAISGSGSLVKAGEGTLVLSGNNSGFSGPVAISAGRLTAGSANALASGILTLGDAATLTSDVPELMLPSGVTISGKSITATAQAVSSWISGLGGTLSGATILKRGSGTLTIGHATTFSSTVNVVTSSSALTVEAGNLAFSSVTALSSNSTVTLGNASTGTDPTVIEVAAAAGTDQVVFNSAMALAPIATDSVATIRYPGYPLSSGASVFGGTLALNGRDIHLENSSNVTPNAITRLYAVSSLISGTGNVRVRAGALEDGNFTAASRIRLTAAGNSWTGDLYIETGMLQVGNGSATTTTTIPDTSVVHLAAGTRMGIGSSSATPETIGGLSGGAASGDKIAASVTPSIGTGVARVTVNVSGSNSHVYDGSLANDGSFTLNFTKSGTGTQTINGACSATGPTAVTGGTLVLNNTYSSSIAVSAGAKLMGNTNSSTALTATAAGATVAPGNSTGAMNFSQVILTGGGILEIEINDAATPKADHITASTGLYIADCTLNLNITGSLTQPAYVIASYGTLTGQFGTVNGLPSGYGINYAYNDGVSSNNIAIVPMSDGYHTWLANYPSITGANGSPDVDFDNDGIANGIEFVIGTDPSVTTTSGLPTGVVIDSNFVFSFKRSEASKAYPVKVEYGTTLADWPGQILIPTTDTVGPPVTVVGTDVTVLIPMDGDPKKFARLNVNIPYTP